MILPVLCLTHIFQLNKYLCYSENGIFINDKEHVARITLKSKLKKYLYRNYEQYYRECSRADTRQVISALIESDYNCDSLIKIIYPNDINFYISQLKKFSSFNRLEKAWHEISHLSHLLFEISLIESDSKIIGASCFPYLDTISEKFSYFINSIEKETSYDLKTQNNMKYLINGLMKLFSGFIRVNYTPNFDYKKILDIILNYNFQNNACDYLNTIYVVDFCLQNYNYKNLDRLYGYLDTMINDIFGKYYYSDLEKISIVYLKNPILFRLFGKNLVLF